jgi:hypothetical protein
MRKRTWVLVVSIAAGLGILGMNACGRREAHDVVPATSRAGAGTDTIYTDPLGRFSFRYPKRFGEVIQGSESAYGGRAVSLRFRLNWRRLSRPHEPAGEIVITQGRVTIDQGACGLLYDADLARQLFREDEWARVLDALPPLSLATFCDALKSESPLQLDAKSLGGLDSGRIKLITLMDGLGHRDPEVRLCQRDGDGILFHEVATEERDPRSGRRHIFGCVRFLGGQYSSVQYVQKSPAAPPLRHLVAIRDMIRSVRISEDGP